MPDFINPMIAGITAFAATNIDDIVILMLFFAQVNERLRPRQIVIGQYCGFIVLILASLPGFLGGYMVPKPWLGLLGLLPIAIGISHLLQTNATDDPAPPIQLVSEAGLPKGWKSSKYLAWLFQPQVYQVAAVTVANGGDNVGIYVPLFANSSVVGFSIILGVFFLMIGIWCAIAYSLARHPAIAHTLTHYGHRVVPIVLIGLGLYILLESEAYRVFRSM